MKSEQQPLFSAPEQGTFANSVCESWPSLCRFRVYGASAAGLVVLLLVLFTIPNEDMPFPSLYTQVRVGTAALGPQKMDQDVRVEALAQPARQGYRPRPRGFHQRKLTEPTVTVPTAQDSSVSSVSNFRVSQVRHDVPSTPLIMAATGAQQESFLNSLPMVMVGCLMFVAAFVAGRHTSIKEHTQFAMMSIKAKASTQDYVDKADKYILGTYGKRAMVFESGQGTYITDLDGNTFLDFTSGIAVNCLGHSDPGWAQAVADQAHILTHTSNLYVTLPQADLAEKLVNSCEFASKAFFCNSGTEANEAAIKFARKFAKTNFPSNPSKTGIVSFTGSFHGRTMGALALTHKDYYRTPFAPLMSDAENFGEYNSTDGLDDLITENTCAVFAEPVQGEGGVNPSTGVFLDAVRKRCDEVGALLVYDEVQCGLGRTGAVWGHQANGLACPDLLTAAKPLAAGLPIGAVLISSKVAEVMAPGDHGSTFAGGPLVLAAANYTWDRVTDPKFLADVKDKAAYAMDALRPLEAHTDIKEVRGSGLLIGIEFLTVEECGAVVGRLKDEKVLALTAGKGNVLRLAPPLTVSKAEIDIFVEALKKALA